MAIGKQLSDGNPDGTSLGQSASDLVSLYGVTPASQRASSIQADSIISVSSNITIAASLVAWIREVSDTLESIGAWKGSA
jgi:hypothetical protein